MATYELGILAALGALVCWTIGDYFIQKSTREIGDWKALFYNGFFGILILTPFVYRDIPGIFSASPENFLLLGVAAITFFAAIFEFEALREGKLSVIEPVMGTELLFTVALSFLLLGETLSTLQTMLVIIAFIGILFAVTRKMEHLKFHQRLLERGVLIALLGASTMGAVNFLTGISSRATSPLLTLWTVEAVLLIVCAAYMTTRREFPNMLRDLKKYPIPILAEGIVDNVAWIFFAFSMTLIPISIATTVSETYIIFTAFLGIKLNREKIKPHQKIGAAIAIASILILAAQGL